MTTPQTPNTPSTAMSRTPTQEAKGIAAAQIDAYLEAGQPFCDCGCWKEASAKRKAHGCKRCTAVAAALLRLADRLHLASG
jgi:hypothetical protein